MASQIKTFNAVGDFEAMYAAEGLLRAAGFSVGHSQRGAPRGILYGDYCIAKWRNLHSTERDAMHGQMIGDMRNGPVQIEIFDTAPDEARKSFHKTAVSSPDPQETIEPTTTESQPNCT